MIRLRHLLPIILLLGAQLATARGQAVERRCFAETGQCIEGRFRDYWEQNGGLAVFGYPITPARPETNSDTGQRYLTQWFERNRFEAHPGNAAPYDVLLGRLSDARLRQTGVNWQTAPRESGARAGCLWFAETGHNVCNQGGTQGFMAYWQSHGLQDARLDAYARSLALFGLPLTGQRIETNASGDRVITQWFERARFEWHPDQPDAGAPGARVLLGLLGREAQVPLQPPAPSGAIAYTVLGDSIAAGLFAQRPYDRRYAETIQTTSGTQVSITNLGRIAWTGTQLLDALRTNAAFRRSVTQARVLTWNIGGNELQDARLLYRSGRCGGADNQECLRTTTARFKQNWDAILVEILALSQPAETALRTMDMYNPFVAEDRRSDSWAADGGLNDFAVLREYLDEINASIADSSEARGIPVAPVYRSFNGQDGAQDPIAAGLLAFDNLHPNDAGHARIAELLHALGYAPIR